MTTDAIVRLFTRRRKPLMDAVLADRLAIARYYIRKRGDEVRAFNAWKDDYKIRKGVAA